MSNISITALNRKFEQKKGYGVERRDEIVEPIERKKVGVCAICKLPVLASPGQMIRPDTHKACRKSKRY